MLRLSEAEPKMDDNDGSTLLMVGSFAPVHAGHIDAMASAERALLRNGEQVKSAVFTPNSDSYVLKKVDDDGSHWSFDRRVAEFSRIAYTLNTLAYVDDITGVHSPERSITKEAIDTIIRNLGAKACKIAIVVGSDQIASMEPYIESNNVVCVKRPGSPMPVMQPWLRRAIESGQCTITDRELRERDINSTSIRASRQHLNMRSE